MRALLDELLPRIVALAEGEPGREVCGVVLAGRDGPELVPFANVAAAPERTFELAPRDVLAALRRVDAEQARLAAMYHSHPSGGASLSPRDIRGLTLDGHPVLPGAELWVVAMEEGRAVEVRSYRWAADAYVERDRRVAPFTV